VPIFLFLLGESSTRRTLAPHLWLNIPTIPPFVSVPGSTSFYPEASIVTREGLRSTFGLPFAVPICVWVFPGRRPLFLHMRVSLAAALVVFPACRLPASVFLPTRLRLRGRCGISHGPFVILLDI